MRMKNKNRIFFWLQSSEVLNRLRDVELLCLKRAVPVSKDVNIECMTVRVGTL